MRSRPAALEPPQTAFTQIGVDYTKPADEVHRISVGLDFNRDCGNRTGQSACNLIGEGYVTEPATLNITTDSTPKIEVVREKANKPFNDTVTGSAGSTLIILYRNELGSIVFTTQMRCFTGTLGDCIGGDVEARIAIEACTPIMVTGSFFLNDDDDDDAVTLDGSIAFVSVNASDVANMSINPAAAKSENISSNNKADEKHNGAARVSGEAGAVAVVVAGTVFRLL